MGIRDRYQHIPWEIIEIERKNREHISAPALFLRDGEREIIILCKDVPSGIIEDGDVIIRPINAKKDRLVVVDHGFTRGVGDMSEALREIAHDYYLIRWKKENAAESAQPNARASNQPADTVAKDVLPSKQKGTVFISYSHKDSIWLDRLKEHLKPLEQAGVLNVWDDKRIPPGADWQKEIHDALATASVAVLLVSPSFHASDFITKYELPSLKEQTTILWVPISASLYDQTPLAQIQAAYDPAQPLDGLTPSKRSKALVAICKQIIAAYEKANSPNPS